MRAWLYENYGFLDFIKKYANIKKGDIMSDNGFKLIKGIEHSSKVITLANKVKFFISEPMIFEKISNSEE